MESTVANRPLKLPRWAWHARWAMALVVAVSFGPSAHAAGHGGRGKHASQKDGVDRHHKKGRRHSASGRRHGHGRHQVERHHGHKHELFQTPTTPATPTAPALVPMLPSAPPAAATGVVVPPPPAAIPAAPAAPVPPIGTASSVPAAAPVVAPAPAAKGAAVDSVDPNALLAPGHFGRKIGWQGRILDIGAYAGAAIPSNGRFAEELRVGGSYGGTLSKEFWAHRWVALALQAGYRFTDLRTRVATSEAAAHGFLRMHEATLRLTYLIGPWRVRPFLGGGVGAYAWKAHATDALAVTPIREQHHVDVGGHAVVGVNWAVLDHLFLAPEGGWTFVAGHFSHALWNAGLQVRWRF